MTGRPTIQRIAAFASSLLLACAPVLAQQTVRNHPAPDSTALYTSFFFFHEDFAKWTAARIAADPAHRDRLIASSAHYLGVTPTDFSILETITAQVSRELRDVGNEAHDYVEAASKDREGFDRTALAGYNDRRAAIIEAGVHRMESALSPDGWKALHSYINNRHRNHVNVTGLASALH